MPTGHPAKTASALRYIFLIAAILAAAFLLRVIVPSHGPLPCQEVVTESKEIHVKGDDQWRVRIQADIASDSAARTKGLSGRDCLGEDEGMLFLFHEAGDYCFWMKDMKFAIDMIWLDSEEKIVHMEQNVKPETYPASFCPSRPAEYVLEINAGKSAEYGFEVGTILEL